MSPTAFGLGSSRAFGIGKSSGPSIPLTGFPSYSESVVETNLILYYLFGSSLTAPAYDDTVYNIASSSYTGTLNNLTLDPNGYLIFGYDGTNGSGGSITFDSNPTFTNYTLELWFKPLSTYSGGGSEGFFFSDSNQRGFGYIQQDGVFAARSMRIFRPTGSSGSGTLNANTWYHVVMTTGSTDLQIIYRNASSVFFGSNDPNSTLSTVTHIGVENPTRFTNGSGWLRGHVGEIRIYNSILDSTQITTNFNATRTKYGV